MKIYQNDKYVLIISDGYYGIIYDKELKYFIVTHNAGTIIDEYKNFKELNIFEFILNENNNILEKNKEKITKKILSYPYGVKKKKDEFLKNLKEFFEVLLWNV